MAWAAVTWEKRSEQMRNRTEVGFAMSPAMVSPGLVFAYSASLGNWGWHLRSGGEIKFPGLIVI